MPTSVLSASFYVQGKIPIWKQADQDLKSCKILHTKHQKESFKDTPEEFFDPFRDDVKVCVSATL